MSTYRGLLDGATEQLYDSCETPRIDAEVLMQHVIERPLAWLIAYGDTIATSDHVTAFDKLINQRYAGQPVAYLTGKRDFWTLSLAVNENVLIPRPDTETLVEQALQRIPRGSSLDALDLGTGSGAIALAIAKERPKANVIAIDSQISALDVAKDNALRNEITNVQFLQSDWFTNIPKGKKFNIIASNPPYIEAADPHLERGDLRFEPEIALIADEHGISDLKRIIEQSVDYLHHKAWLIVEHGYNQADRVADLFKEHHYQNVELFHDLNNLPRCSAGQFEPA